MGETRHKVEEQPGVSIHREIPAARAAENFDTSQMSQRTKDAWKKVCVEGDASPEDYRHVLESIMTSGVVKAIVD
ncbi:hypothetical protein [Maridesulfovibrio sp.]|uniref:hypothetical protein n=1 Tax=Maridesulfovibrio sp. TaxID=2795000 RepID=UPI002A18B6ED|nr:hypothetical protein [Maridesulfovibrio sp.]